MANDNVSESQDSWDDWMNFIKEEDFEKLERTALQDIEDTIPKTVLQDIEDSIQRTVLQDIEDIIPRTAPLYNMRRGHLWVSDLSSQVWCEQKLVYNFQPPVPVVYVPEPEYVTAGKNIHLARELEVQEAVPVKITSREDSFAVKLLNLLTGVESFHLGNSVLREIPVFGVPFGSGIFVSGIIDEVRLDVQAFEIDIVELKTRREKTVPAESTRIGYRFQVMLYKKLLDDLILGNLDKETIAKHLKLNLKKEFGEDLLMMLRDRMMSGWNLMKLFDQVLNALQTIPRPNNMFIEYCHQEDGQTFDLEPVEFDEQWLNDTCQRFFQFWKGNREPEGVPMDQLWKCRYCDFINVCEWRKKKSKEFKIGIEEICISD